MGHSSALLAGELEPPVAGRDLLILSTVGRTISSDGEKSARQKGSSPDTGRTSLAANLVANWKGDSRRYSEGFRGRSTSQLQDRSSVAADHGGKGAGGSQANNAGTGQVTLGDSGTIGLWMGVKLFGNSTGVAFETVEGHLSILADLDKVAVGITHVATPFPAVIV